MGAGGLGTLFGARLASVARVTVLVRDERAAGAVRARGGLRLEGGAPADAAVTADPRALRDAAIVLVAVKTYATHAALAPLRDIVPAATLLVSLQNGFDAVEAFERALGPRAGIALAPTTEAALRLATGHARHTGRGRTMLGWARGRAGGAAVDEFAALLRAAGFETAPAAPIEAHVWAKAIVNAAINPLSALAGVPNGALLERPELAARFAAIAREGAAVAAAVGIALPFADAAAHAADVIRATATNRSSMLQDLDAGRPTEIEAIAGALVRRARRAGLEVPETERALDEVRARTKA